MTVPLYNLTDTWNDGGTTFTAIQMDVTDTASAAASLLMDLQVADAPKFSVAKSGTAYIYNAFTDSSNYERGAITWSSNVLQIRTQTAGTGTIRQILMCADNSGTEVRVDPALNQVRICTGGSTCTFGGTVQMGSIVQIGGTDTTLSRTAAKVLRFGDGGANTNGWIQWAGQERVTADVNSNNTTTLAVATGLSIALQAGRTYSFEAFLSFTCTAAQGIRAAMVGSGGLTATDIIYDGWIVDSDANGIKGNAQATALGAVVANAATTGTAGHVLIRGTITVNLAGTIQVHFAQSVAAANNTTVKRGSYLVVHDID